MNPTKDIAGSEQLRAILERFRKQCVNKGGGVGFEQTIADLEAHEAAAIQAFGEKLLSQKQRLWKQKGDDAVFNPMGEIYAVPITAIQEALMPDTPTKDKEE